MAKVQLEIRPLLIQAQGPIAVGTGFRNGLVHRTVERDAEGFVYVPASSLKGRTRAACEQLAAHAGLRVCRAPRPEGMCAGDEAPCVICRIFGSPGRPGGLHWRDARLVKEYRTDEFRKAQSYARTQVQLSRVLGSAAAKRLYTTEFALEGLTFESGITGWLEITPIAGDPSTGGYELMLLLAGLRLVNAIGGNKTRGAGACEIVLPDRVLLDDREIPWQETLEYFDLLYAFDEEAGNGR